jgi:hypothetical protein
MHVRENRTDKPEDEGDCEEGVKYGFHGSVSRFEHSGN